MTEIHKLIQLLKNWYQIGSSDDKFHRFIVIDR